MFYIQFRLKTFFDIKLIKFKYFIVQNLVIEIIFKKKKNESNND